MIDAMDTQKPTKIFEKRAEVFSLLANIDQLQNRVFEDEIKNVRSAVESRRREFVAGRNIARQCLAEFGCNEAVIPVLESRAPDWPAGFTGSISHSSGIVGAAICRASEYRAIGLDIEKCSAVTPGLFDSVLTEDDLESIGGAPDSSHATLIFCCKESVYKAVSPISNEALDFSNICIAINENSFTAKCDPCKASSPLVAMGRGFLEIEDGFVRTLFLIK